MKAPVLGSVLVVRLLRSRAGQAVLGLAGARTQAVQSPTVLSIIDVVLKEKLKENKSFKHFQLNFDFFLGGDKVQELYKCDVTPSLCGCYLFHSEESHAGEQRV